MIDVKFRVFKNGFFKFSCEGHAGAGEYGHDTVCAAASALAYGLAENIRVSGEMLKEANVEEHEGCMKIRFKPKDDYLPSMYLLFTAKRNEFKALERGHEEFIKVW